MNKKSEYGELLTNLIKNKGISQSKFYLELKIKKPYFYDIVSGKVNPPPIEKQIEIINYLSIDYESILKLVDAAAKARNEIPLDLYLFLSNKENVELIRKSNKYFDEVGGILKCQKN